MCWNFQLRQGQGGKALGEVAKVLVMRPRGCDNCMIYSRDKTERAGKTGEPRTEGLGWGEVSREACGAHSEPWEGRGRMEEGKTGLDFSYF